MSETTNNSSTRYGTAGGILTVFIANISSADVTRTMLLAAIGAVVSFIVSLLLKYCVAKWRK